jgi:hypothetical protein
MDFEHKSILANVRLAIKSIIQICLITSVLFFSVDWYISKFQTQLVSNVFGHAVVVRNRHPVFHHGLNKNVNILIDYGRGLPYLICTDSHGFRASCRGGSDQDNSRHFDVGFIGDSFTEGVGIKFEDTFVGLFADANKGLTVANLGVVSYSPSIYLSKLKYLINNGYKFDHIIILPDISDIQDEAVNTDLEDDIVVDKVQGLTWGSYKTDAVIKWLLSELKKSFVITSHIALIFERFDHLIARLANNDVKLSDFSGNPAHLPPLNFGEGEYRRSEWTKLENSPFYGKDDISGGISQSLKRMSELHNFLSANGIKMSIAVYPWPMQLLDGNKKHKGTQVWADFCENRCYKYIDSNPAFFNEVERSTVDEAIVRNFIHNDVHFNAHGHHLLFSVIQEAFGTN